MVLNRLRNLNGAVKPILLRPDLSGRRITISEEDNRASGSVILPVLLFAFFFSPRPLPR